METSVLWREVFGSEIQ
uniref:Uncharacterized protein n=1 Tax=Anguilla anguilla TaxID=7936 RepID=A0A0E9UZT3_ANGAN